MEEEKFYLHIPVTDLLLKSEGEDKDGRRCVKGYASTGDIDQDGEQVIQKGIDFSYLKKNGFINYDHLGKCLNCGSHYPGNSCPNCGAVGKQPLIIGVPTQVEMHDRGLWLESELFKSGGSATSEQLRMANEMWEFGQALKKSGNGRSLAYSIEGGILERRGKKVVRSRANHAALTHKPVNTSCSVETFVKSLCCGRCSPHHPDYNPAHKCGNKHVDVTLPELSQGLEKAASTATQGALMLQNLDRGISSVLYGDKDCGCYDSHTGRFHKGLNGAIDHMTKCLGKPKKDSITFLKHIIGGAGNSADLAALAVTAGLIRH